ncbi:MAG: NnrU family protein [Rhodospirillales bacterium]
MAPYEELWSSPGWTRLIPLAAMPLVLIMFACAQKSIGMLAITRHPMLWALFLWAGAHIPVNGGGGRYAGAGRSA